MAIKLKTKLSLGLSFLFMVILLFGIMGIFYISKLKEDANKIIQNNYESLVYANNMLQNLEQLRFDSSSKTNFEKNLSNQEANITEPGEEEATVNLRNDYDNFKKDPNNVQSIAKIKEGIVNISKINQQAIFRKSEIAQKTADNAVFVLTILFTILTIVAFTFTVNFPDIISQPVRALSEGISAIANKQYDKRIHLTQKDEFGELANAFNTMAQKLNEYEHSNLAKIKFEKSRIETIINQMRDGIIGLDEKRNILFLNVVAENLLGLKEKEIIGKYAPDLALRNDLMRILLIKETENKELKIFADNKESYFNVDFLTVMNAESVIGQVLVLRNITPFHELNEAKTNFIATVSHELKTPIASIKMSASLLTNKKIGHLNEEQSELTQSIVDDAERLLKITGELLNMSQVETGNIQLKLLPIEPSTFIENSLNSIQFQAIQKGIHLEIAEYKSLPNILADQEKTSWVMVNLLTNAIKYSSENGIIKISFKINNPFLEIHVQDFGKGIESKYLTKIFERYFKVPGTHERTGTGLGLAISKEFIEAQQGILSVESNIGEGSIFKFSLPLA